MGASGAPVLKRARFWSNASCADCSLRALSLKRLGSRPLSVMRPSLFCEREPSRNRLTSWLAWYWPLAWRQTSSALAE